MGLFSEAPLLDTELHPPKEVEFCPHLSIKRGPLGPIFVVPVRAPPGGIFPLRRRVSFFSPPKRCWDTLSE